MQGFRISPSEIQCYSPPLDAGMYPLEVSLNDQDYTHHRYPFLYFEDQVSPLSIHHGWSEDSTHLFELAFPGDRDWCTDSIV